VVVAGIIVVVAAIAVVVVAVVVVDDIVDDIGDEVDLLAASGWSDGESCILELMYGGRLVRRFFRRALRELGVVLFL